MTEIDLSTLEKRVSDLERKVNKHESQIGDIEAAFYGTDRDPERQEWLRRVGILERLDNLPGQIAAEIARVLPAEIAKALK